MKNPFSKETILKVREKLEEIEELLNRSGIHVKELLSTAIFKMRQEVIDE